eukprot:3152491-Rhodomonas_salina.2
MVPAHASRIKAATSNARTVRLYRPSSSAAGRGGFSQGKEEGRFQTFWSRGHFRTSLPPRVDGRDGDLSAQRSRRQLLATLTTHKGRWNPSTEAVLQQTEAARGHPPLLYRSDEGHKCSVHRPAGGLGLPHLDQSICVPGAESISDGFDVTESAGPRRLCWLARGPWAVKRPRGTPPYRATHSLFDVQSCGGQEDQARDRAAQVLRRGS